MAEQKIESLRDFPSVEQLLQKRSLAVDVNSVPRPLASEIVKTVVSDLKSDFKREGKPVSMTMLLKEIKRRIRGLARQQIQPVINATGIVVHTNLGRAPLSNELFDAVKEAVTGYTNVEFDLAGGARGNRGEACEKYLSVLTGSEAATVVNNCAAALFLILNSLSNKKRVVISRGELVQIGGGFRIPDILRRSGANLAEVGTTNITSLTDYESAIDDKTGLILKVHQSNFAQSGFTEQITARQLVELAHKHGLPLINDLGSGVLVPTSDILGHREPSVQQAVRDGADLTCFSGDKLLGGMQAGLIVGSRHLVNTIKKNPIFRTVRVDKVVFATLEKLLTAYLNGTYQNDIKLWSLLSVSESELYKRGKEIYKKLGSPSELSVEATRAYVGGGALPEAAIPSVALVFAKEFSANKLMAAFREAVPPVIGRIEDDRFVLDLKAVDEAHLDILTNLIKEQLKRRIS